MVFSSLTFLCYFLPVFLIAYLALPRYRNPVLLTFSIVFYAWGEVLYVGLLIFSILCNFYCGLRIDSARSPESRRFYLILALAGNLGALIVLKYFTFLLGVFEQWTALELPLPAMLRKLPLPLGVSFFTFQAMSYIIDLYRREVEVERSAMSLATYIVMFPQLVAGPIVRYQTVSHELHHREVRLEAFAQGAWLFTVGLASKVLLANTFAAPVDAIFALDPRHLTPGAAWLGAIAYGYQIYFDFAGYSVMAIGLGRILGFNFPVNFNIPYVSQSVTEFWRRWHISLSTWFRDYLYIPLGGNRGGALVTYRNLIIVFALCGLWHGASWSFLVWGLYHGVFLVLERAFRRWPIGRWTPRPLRHAYLLLAVLVGWVFFRCETLTQALAYLGVMFGLQDGLGYYATSLYFSPFLLAAMVAAAFLSVTNAETMRRLGEWLRIQSALQPAMRTVTLVVLFCLCLFMLIVGTSNPFIYFRF